MNNKIFFFFFLLSLFKLNSQTLDERKKIINEYNHIQIETIFDRLISIRKNDSIILSRFLSRNNIEEKINVGDRIYKIYKIIDNKPIYISTDNVNSAISTRTNFLGVGGGLSLNLQGQNMHIATWDGGPTLATHREFQSNDIPPISRVLNPDLSASNSQSNHSTHVSGTLIAKGVSSNAKGMAPKATLTSFDWDNDYLEVLNEATNNGLLISNHSYGIPIYNDEGQLNAPIWMMGCYDSDARLWDEILYQAPYYLMVTSAGNDGESIYSGGLLPDYDKLTSNKNSKNNLVVGNANNPLINPNGSGILLSLFINTTSSQGPTDDGRIKPDLCGDGTDVYSSISTSNSSYATYSGTSMSSPNVAGTLLLLQEYYNQLYNHYMKASTLKAIACHTADDDFFQEGPDAIFGWGLLNAKFAAETITKSINNQSIVYEGVLNNIDKTSLNFEIKALGTEPLSVTLCWTDPAGDSHNNSLNNSTPVLVNDLDLRITKGTTTYYPWKLQLSNVAAQAIKGDNIVDTVENIDINDPINDTYIISVTHKGTLINSYQNYSLIVTGLEQGSSSLDSEEYANEKIKIYPNPSSGFVKIILPKYIDDLVYINLYDNVGRKVDSLRYEKYNGYELILNYYELTKGIYTIEIKANNFFNSQRLIME